jgi:hypothetical protein
LKLTKPRKENIEKERSRRKKGKKKKHKVSTKENSRERWWTIKEPAKQPNL